MPKRELNSDISNSNTKKTRTQSNKLQDKDVLNKRIERKGLRSGGDPVEIKAKHGQFQSLKRINVRLWFYDTDEGRWILTSIVRIDENRKTFGGKPCTSVYLLQPILDNIEKTNETKLRDNSLVTIEVPFFGKGFKGKFPSYSINKLTQVVDPVRQSLKESNSKEAKPEIYMYLKGLLTQKKKHEWMESKLKQANDTKYGCKEFDFVELMDNLLSDDCISFSNLITHVNNSQDSKNIINVAVGNDSACHDVFNVIAHLVGTIMGIELDHLDAQKTESSSKPKIDSAVKAISNARGNNCHSLEEFHKLECPVAKVVLCSAMATHLKKVSAFSPKHETLKNDTIQKFFCKNPTPENKIGLEKRLKKLMCSLVSLHSAQHSNNATVSGDASELRWNKLMNGVLLYLDKKGCSESTFNEMASLGLTPVANSIRTFIHGIAGDLGIHNIRMHSKDGLVPVKAIVWDNADVHLFGKCKSMIGIADILLDNETDKENKELTKNYQIGFPKINDDFIKTILPSKLDDDVAQNGIDIQNMHALYTAFIYINSEANDTSTSNGKSNAGGDLHEDSVFVMNTKVQFQFLNDNTTRQGVIIDTPSVKSRTVEYKDENDDESIITLDISRLSIPPDFEEMQSSVREIDELLAKDSTETEETEETEGIDAVGGTIDELLAKDSTETEDTNDSTNNQPLADDPKHILDSESFKKKMEEFVKGVDDGGGRKVNMANTTIVLDILDGLSSKNSTATQEVIDRIINRYPDFWKNVWILSSDQEFMPTLYRKFFQSTHEIDKRKILPLILPLAMFHAIKAMVVSMFSFYRPITDLILQGQGYTIGSSKYKRVCEGKHIKVSIRCMVNIVENLRISLAKAFLLETESGRNDTNKARLQVISQALDLCNKRGEKRVALDSFGRPQSIPFSTAMLDLAKEFQSWVMSRTGESNPKFRVGPSGFIHGDQDFVERFKAESIDIGQKDENIPEEIEPEFRDIWKLPYGADGDEVGLRKRCIELKIFCKSNKSFRANAMRLYTYRKNYKNYGDEMRAVKEANEYNPDKNIMRKFNDDEVCLSSKLQADLLFGPESYALVWGCLLTRIDDTNDSKRKAGAKKKAFCGNCRKKVVNCRCTDHHEFIVVLKSMAHSVFMRNQAHYQHLSCNQLIYLAGVLEHENSTVANCVLRRCRKAWSVDEKGDSMNKQPIDALQEFRNIKTIKDFGTRNVHAMNLMTQRVAFMSAVIAKTVEQRFENAKGKLPNQYGSQTERARKLQEIEMNNASLCVWNTIIEAIDSSRQQPANKALIIGTNYEFLCKERFYYRVADAAAYLELSIKSMLTGYQKKIEVKLPLRSRKAMPTIHKVITKTSSKPKKTNAITIQKQHAKMLSDEAKHDASKEPFEIKLRSDSTIFKELAEAGIGKHNIIGLILNQLESNAKIEGNIGGGEHCPIYLSNVQSEANKVIQDMIRRSDGISSSPLIVLVDFLKDLQCAPPRRDGGAYTYTVRELARDIITWAAYKYHRNHNSLLIMFVDVEDKCTHLRKIQRIKRGKVQNVADNLTNILRTRNPDVLLSSIGEFSDLMRNEKATFGPFLGDIIGSELKTVDAENWKPSTLFHNTPVGFVCPGERMVTFLTPEDSFEISSGVQLTRRKLEEILRPVVDQGEGERMIISAIYRIISQTFKQDNSAFIDSCFLIHSEDSDVLAGMAMQLVRSLDNARLQYKLKYHGSIIARGPNKSVASLLKLNKTVRVALDIDLNLQPTGKGWIFHVSMIPLYYHLETKIKKFEHLPYGHRAVAATAAPFAFMLNDYIPAMNGLQYSDFIEAMTSKMFKRCIEGLPVAECSPVVLLNIPYGEDFQSMALQPSTINPSVITLIFTIMLAMRNKTKVQLQKKFVGDEYFSFLSRSGLNGYNIVRAASLIAGELYPAPDPIALISRIHSANFVFKQWCYNVYQQKITPPIGGKELDGTFFHIPMNPRDLSCSMHYNLTHICTKNLISTARKRTTNLNDFLHILHHGVRSEFPFKPLGTSNVSTFTLDVSQSLRDCISNKGLMPITRIKSTLILPENEAKSIEDFDILWQKYDLVPENESIGDRNRRLDSLLNVVSLTLISLTKFNLKGGGRPLLVSNTVMNVSTGGYSGIDAYPKISSWQNDSECDTLSKKTLKELFSIVKKHSQTSLEYSNTLKILRQLVYHVFEKSGMNEEDDISCNSNEAEDELEFSTVGRDDDSIDNGIDNDNDSDSTSDNESIVDLS